MVLWFRRIVWISAVAGWLIVIMAGLLTTASPGEVIACCIMAVVTWVSIYYAFAWKWGIRRKTRLHLGVRPGDAALLMHSLSLRTRVDMIRGLYELSKTSQDFACLGLTMPYSSLQARLASHAEPEKLEWESCQTDVSEWEEIPANAVFFMRHEGTAFVAAVFREALYSAHRDDFDDDDSDSRQPGYGPPRLHILAAEREQCHHVREFLLTLAEKHTVYRRRKIIVRAGERRNRPVQVDFTSLSPLARDRIILPDPIFNTLHRAAMRQLDLEDVLRRAGHRTRTAVLLHGPPGTGKTLLLRHLAGSRTDTTTIMLHGFRRGLVREVFRLARYCQPSVVLIEDVDLIAVQRQRSSRGTSLLHELLDELDGLAPESRTVVLMTTNRPDVLEPALASRPGRISQAIEIPLPDAECRRKLLQLFTAKLDAGQVDFEDWVTRTEGASPAFIEELIRRAILFSTEEERPTAQLTRISNESLSAAMHEILSSGGQLTQRLLGYSG